MKHDNNKKQKYETKYILKFLISSIFGLGSFMVPLPFLDNKSLVAFLSSYLATNFVNLLTYLVLIIVAFSAVMSIISNFISDEKKIYRTIKENFKTTALYLVTKIIASIFLFILVFKINIPIISSKDTGGSMLGLSISLLTIAIALSYVLPFLTNCGIMEFFGVITKDIITPLFKVPGVASLDLITSWFGASNAEVILCREKYHQGYYSKKETAIIMSNFSLVSVSFCYVVTESAGLTDRFTLVFLSACLISIILAVIMPRIKPLSSIPNEYYDKKREIDTSVPDGYTRVGWGLYQGSMRAKEFSLKEIITNGTKIMLGIWFELVPVVIAWGTLGLIIVYHTPIFDIISYPIGVLLNSIGIEEAFKVAPATLVGFIDMFIPALLLVSIKSVKTRFIIALLSLVQMIYLTEVGTVMIQSDIGLSFKRILIIFLERTILSFPLILLLANLIY